MLLHLIMADASREIVDNCYHVFSLYVETFLEEFVIFLLLGNDVYLSCLQSFFVIVSLETLKKF